MQVLQKLIDETDKERGVASSFCYTCKRFNPIATGSTQVGDGKSQGVQNIIIFEL